MADVKVFGSAWSPRHGNTEILVKEALEACEALPGVSTEFWSFAGKSIAPCKSCYACFRNPDPTKPCRGNPVDAFDEALPGFADADGLIVGFPVYYMGVPAQLKAFFDRSMAIESLGAIWRNKVIGFVAVGAARHGGHESAIRDAQNWALLHDLILVGVGPERDARGRGGYLGGMALQGFPQAVSSVTTAGFSAVQQDEMGLRETRSLASRVTEIAKVIKAGYQQVDETELRWGKGPVETTMIASWKQGDTTATGQGGTPNDDDA